MEVNREQETQKQVINMKVKVKKTNKKHYIDRNIKSVCGPVGEMNCRSCFTNGWKKKDLDEIFISLFIFFYLSLESRYQEKKNIGICILNSQTHIFFFVHLFISSMFIINWFLYFKYLQFYCNNKMSKNYSNFLTTWKLLTVCAFAGSVSCYKADKLILLFEHLGLCACSQLMSCFQSGVSKSLNLNS